MSITSIEEVNSFLNSFKDKVERGIPIVYVNRRKNLLALTELSITPSKRTAFIMRLTSDDYSSGPSPDHHGGTPIWVFGIRIENKEVYIKITLKEGFNPCTCISFHIAEHPMNYPLSTT